VLLDLILRHEANTARPASWRVVEHVENLEAVRMLRGEVVQLLFEENVLVVDIGIDKAQLRGVHRVLEDGTDDLKHGCDASTTGNHANFASEAQFVVELALGTLDLNLVANLEQRNVTRDVTLLVSLDATELSELV
jgi:hypothetical protein